MIDPVLNLSYPLPEGLSSSTGGTSISSDRARPLILGLVQPLQCDTVKPTEFWCGLERESEIFYNKIDISGALSSHNGHWLRIQPADISCFADETIIIPIRSGNHVIGPGGEGGCRESIVSCDISLRLSHRI